MALLSCLGAISGTSMDGIDVAWIETDGENAVHARAGATLPYPPALRAQLLDFLKDPARAETDPLMELEAAVTQAFGDAILAFMEGQGLKPAGVDLIGLHGQTVWHRPAKRFTRQLGDGAALARRIGVDVVDGFRLADVAAGGQGAPLVPLYHAALSATLEQPLMVLNLGGVANITYIAGETVIACDTGPASALIDDYMRRRFGLPFDAGGRIARQGRVHAPTLAALMENPFFALPPPKSLDRNDFHARAKIVEALPDEDAVATLAAFTVEATAAILAHLPRAPRRWLVAGGGRLNPVIMEGLSSRLGVPFSPCESVGWNGDALEAECFAWLAARSLKGLPLSLPTTTGVPEPMPGGRLWRG